MSTATPRQLNYLATLHQRIADAKGVTLTDVRVDAGLLSPNAFGRFETRVPSKATASRLINDAKQQLETLT